MRKAVIGVLAAVLASFSVPAVSSADVPSGSRPRPRPSEGCDAPAVAPGEETITTIANGAERWYLRHIPPQYDGTEPMPLVLDLHGYLEGATIHAIHSRLGEFGDEQGFITLTPHGTGDPVLWLSVSDSNDVKFFEQLLDEVEAELCIDRRRIFVTGLSNGAMMTTVLGCDLADRVAAIAPVAGILDVRPCKPDRPLPVIAFHGTADQYVSFEGGLGASAEQLPAPGQVDGEIGDVGGDLLGGKSISEIVAGWAKRNGCKKKPSEKPLASDVTRHRYSRCKQGATVELYEIIGGGHSWPGSEFSKAIENAVGPVTFSISANEVMWEFFEQHPLK